MKKVSIIIPCYNCGALVGETLYCLQNQTYKDFEVICVNDGSTDDTLALLEKYKNNGSLDMVIVDKKNGGVSTARNCGIENANGEYILFLDSDDICHTQFVERMVGALKDADISYCKLTKNLDEVYSCDEPDENFKMHTRTQAMNKLLYEMGKYGFCCYLYKKSVLVDNNILFDENTKFGEDREFNWKYLCHCNTAAWIDMPLYGYRTNENSATRKGASWRKTDLLCAVERIENYLAENNCEYTDEFKSYMYARSMWAVAKTFAVSREKALFKRLMKEYDVKKCMKRTAKDANKLVKIASVMYLINPMLFYFIVGMKG